MPCIEPVTPVRSSCYRTQLGCWKPNLGYHNTELYPLTPKAVTYAMDPVKSDSLKFPSLVSNLHRNPMHSSQAALYTRYTPQEWFQKQVKYYNEADSNRHYSERIRNDAVKIMREAEERIQMGQFDTGKRLGERITDVTFWRNEVSSELERLIQEIDRLQDCRSVVEKAIQDIQSPLHIVEECLYYREGRKGTELVHDDTEKCLLYEVSNLKSCQRRLEACLDKCKDQLRNCRNSQNQLEIDLKKKENCLGIDSHCHQLNNHSEGLQYFSGIEKFDPCTSEQETWAMAANRIIQASQTERALSRQLRSEAESLLNRTAQDIWDAWSTTNNALSCRISEMLEAKNSLQQHLHKLQQEIFDVEKNMELMRKAIADKSYHLKVALTRLEARMHRPDLELCRDHAHVSLQREIDEINQQVERMHKSLKEIENQHQKLLRTKSALEHDLALKLDSLYIDREKVTGIRRAYPVNALFRF